MDREAVLRDVREAREEIEGDLPPTERLYELVKAFEDSVAVLLSESSLITYVNARLTLAKDFQYRP